MLRLIADEERMRPIPLSLREVAKEAGITAPAIYRHFPDKETLGLEAAHCLFEQLLAAMDRADEEVVDRSPAARFAAVAHGYCRFAEENPAGFRLMFTVPPEALAGRSANPAAVAERWCAAVSRLIGEDVRTVRETAMSSWSTLHGRLMLDLPARGMWPQGDAHEFVEDLARSVADVGWLSRCCCRSSSRE